MATDPIFAATPKAWAGIAPATADTSLTAPTNVTTVVTAGSSGTKIEQLRCNQLATTSATSIVNVFLYDGSTYHLFDFFSMATATLSTTSEVTPTDKFYQNLVLQSGWSLRITVTTAGAQSNFKVLAFGADF